MLFRSSYRGAEERTLEEIKAQRERGYRRFVLAGQSFGGRVALELGATSELFAVLAMAPGMEATVGNSRTQAPTDERLRGAKAERIVVIFPGEDALFGNIDRASSAGPILARLARPYFMVDERGGLKGHGGGTGGNFALRYGRCLDDFLSTPTVPAGRFDCAAGGGWPVARLLVPALPPGARVAAPEALPVEARAMAGLWYGVVGDSIVAWALVETDKPGHGMFYAWASSGASRGGGIYEAVVTGGQVRATLPNQAVLAVRSRDAHTLALTWTPAPAPTNFGIVAPRVEVLHGDLTLTEAR